MQAGYTKPKVKEVTPSQSCYIIAKKVSLCIYLNQSDDCTRSKVGTSDNKGLKVTTVS